MKERRPYKNDPHIKVIETDKKMERIKSILCHVITPQNLFRCLSLKASAKKSYLYKLSRLAKEQKNY